MQGAVTFFEEFDCTSHHGMVWASEDPHSNAFYTADELGYRSIADNMATSLMVPFGYSVDMYDSASFSGDSFTVEGPLWLDNDLNMKCISIENVYNDRMSSVRVYRTGAYGSARGYWKGFTSTETMKFSTHYGFSTTHEEAKTEE